MRVTDPEFLLQMLDDGRISAYNETGDISRPLRPEEIGHLAAALLAEISNKDGKITTWELSYIHKGLTIR